MALPIPADDIDIERGGRARGGCVCFHVPGIWQICAALTEDGSAAEWNDPFNEWISSPQAIDGVGVVGTNKVTATRDSSPRRRGHRRMRAWPVIEEPRGAANGRDTREGVWIERELSALSMTAAY